MKTNRLLLAALVTCFSMLATSPASALTETQTTAIQKAVAETREPELAAKAADLVKAARADEQEAVALAAVEAILKKRPGAAEAVVASISKAVPSLSAAVAGKAATMLPKKAHAIARAAIKANPSEAAKITVAVSKAAPKNFDKILYAALDANRQNPSLVVQQILEQNPELLVNPRNRRTETSSHTQPGQRIVFNKNTVITAGGFRIENAQVTKNQDGSFTITGTAVKISDGTSQPYSVTAEEVNPQQGEDDTRVFYARP